MKATPLISVIIPVYNGDKFLKETVQSILNQTISDYEIIVIDDGSTDSTAEVAQSIDKVRYFFQEKSGVGIARNYGIAKSKGSIIAFQDSDDIALPTRLEEQLAEFQKNSDLGALYSYIQNFLSDSVEKPEWLPQSQLETELSCYGTCALMARKEVFNVVGAFNPDYHAAEDLEWLMRVKDANIRVEMLRKVLIKRRVHANNLSGNSKLVRQMTLRLFKDSADRKLKKT